MLLKDIVRRYQKGTSDFNMLKKLDTISDKQLNKIMDIWLDTNIKTHDYINKSYWESKRLFVRDNLPKADIYVYEVDNEIKGFIGIQNNYIAGLFVNRDIQNAGIGSTLLKKVKKINQSLILSVYKKNTQAISFYRKQGFTIIDELVDSETNEIEYTMRWLSEEQIDPNKKYPIKNYDKTIFLKPIIKSKNIQIGDFTYYDDIDGPENFEKQVKHHYDWIDDKLIIGKFCQIGKGIEFIMNGANHDMRGVSTYPFPLITCGPEKAFQEFKDIPSKGDTIIGNDVWFGQNVTVMPGIKIGDGVIIAANSTVVSDIPSYSVYGGNPARLIKKRFSDEQISFLIKLQWWNWDYHKIFNNYKAISTGDWSQLANIEKWT